jgi:predicted NAD/FAD-dependent oxidoreductase
MSMKRIAIVGAGFSGLVLAQRLRDVATVTLFEKSRGVGGRMATRYANDHEFDHGAQFFTARTPAFRAFLQPLIRDRVVANWTPAFVELDRHGTRDRRDWGEQYPHYVGMPRMNAIGKYLSTGRDIRTNTRIEEVRQEKGAWSLVDSDGRCHDGFDWLVLSAPAPQTATLAAAYSGLFALCRARKMRACVALMLGFEAPLDLPWQAAVVRDADISWMSVNSSKPGRAAAFTMLVHSTNAWANAHVDDDLDALRAHLVDEASAVSGMDLRQASYCDVHRWRYANMDKYDGPDCYIDESSKLAACGDWFLRGRVEAAFTSAHALAGKLRGCL